MSRSSPRHRPFLRFAFEVRAYQYKALPFGLSLSPRVFTKVVEAALVPVKGSRHSYPQLPRRLAHSGPVSSTVVRTQGYGRSVTSAGWDFRSTGKRANSPLRRGSLFSAWSGLGQPHSTSLRGACSVNAEMPGVSPAQEGGSTETFSEAPGAYGILSRYHAARIASYETASALASTTEVPRWAWRHGTYRVSLTPSCRRTFSPWSDLAFLRAGVPLEQVSRHVVVSTDASATGWGAMCNGHAAAGLWTGPQLQWHINCLELLAVWLALRRFQNAATREACTGSARTTLRPLVHQPPGRSTLPSHVATRPPSPPLESEASEVASRRSCPRRAQPCSRRALTSARPSGRMRLHPEVLQLIWRCFGDRSGRPVCLPGHVSLPVVFSPCPRGTLGTDALACSWPRGLRKYAFPPVSLLAQTLCKVREDEEQVLLVRLTGPIGRGSQN